MSAVCTEVKCDKDFKVVVTGTCKELDGDADITDKKQCGADTPHICNTKANCLASTNVPAAWTKTKAVCTRCNEGFTHAAGASLNLDASTECTEVSGTDTALLPLCKADEHVVNHKCVPCDKGSVRLAGDDPNTMKDTTCTANVMPVPHSEKCKAGEHVQSHQCVTCPLGMTNAAGDNPHLYDTSCHAIKCLANEHVKAHKCVPCPGDADATKGGNDNHWTNTAGDDASGPDTECYKHVNGKPGSA
jgi:hypothetical protein